MGFNIFNLRWFGIRINRFRILRIFEILKKKSIIYVSIYSFVAVPIVAINGVVGNMVQLPCDISSDNDEVNMVLWYKEGGSEPIYRWDFE